MILLVATTMIATLMIVIINRDKNKNKNVYILFYKKLIFKFSDLNN